MTFEARVWSAAILMALGTCLVACEKPDQPRVGGGSGAVQLAASLTSGQSSQNVRAQLEQQGWRNWRVIDSREGKAPTNRPKFEVLSAELVGSSLGIEGTLRVDFLNDQLMATWFFPESADAYRMALQQLPPNHSMRSAAFGTDYKNRKYALWEDPQLKRELEDWIRKYS